MLNIRFVIENQSAVEDAMKNRQRDPKVVEQCIKSYSEYSKLKNEIEELNSERKSNSKQNGIGNNKEAIETGRKIKERLSVLEKEMNKFEEEYILNLSKIPNVPLKDVPIGIDETMNVVVEKYGKIRDFSFTPLSDHDLGEKMGYFDFKSGVNVAGSRFVYFKAEAVMLQLALTRYFFKLVTDSEFIKDTIVKNGINTKNYKAFVPVIPPIMIKNEVFAKTGRRDPMDDKYYIPNDDLFLVGSSEHTLMPMFMDRILKESELPIRMVGISTCLRRESGSYGKDLKGVLRLHQFDKAEMISISNTEEGIEEHKLLTAIERYLINSLGLPFQEMRLCTGDMGFTNLTQTDMETWMPSENRYRETHSADFNGDYQSRGLNIKYIDEKSGEKVYCYTNDATGFTGRLIKAIIENNQNEDGSFNIPQVLKELI